MDDLQHAFDGLATQLRSLDALFEQGHIWGDDYELSERAMALVDMSESAVSVAGQAPEAALALCRVGIEHQALDSLIMLADKSSVTIHDVPRDEYERWVHKVDPKEISDINYTDGDLTFVRGSGHVPATDSSAAEPISSYHRINRDFVPGMPKPGDATKLIWPGASNDGPGDWLKQNDKTYHRDWKWSAIQRNLLLNDLISKDHLLQLRVHYAFLSQFVHAYPNHMFQRRIAIPSHERKARLRAKELVLCYGLTLLRLEADAVMEFCSRRSRLNDANTSALSRAATTAEHVSSYFWFRGGAPTDADRRSEANQRRWHEAGFSWRPTSGEFGPVSETELEVADLHYYSDPWSRLSQVSPHLR